MRLPEKGPMKNTEPRWIVAALAIALCTSAAAQGRDPGARKGGPAKLALQIADYTLLPMTGSPTGTGNNAGSLARINFMREEPGAAARLLVRKLYLFWWGAEISNNEHIYFLRRYSLPMRVGLWHAGVFFPFGILAPLALAGFSRAVQHA